MFRKERNLTVPVSVQKDIKTRLAQGQSQRRVARELNLSRNTVAKYAAKEDFSPRPKITKPRSKMEPYAQLVTSWLVQDEKMPPKQRHTIQRVWERLVEEEGFTGSYHSVMRWIHRYRVERRHLGQGFSELVWQAGQMQVDYGQARALIDGTEQLVHVLVATLPYSNARFAVASPAQNAECVCAGLRMIFEHIGQVPTRCVFDNASGIGAKHRDGTVTMTRLFEAFATHYGIKVAFTNPYSGHEKGHVENAVGFLRRNLMVPLPRAQSLGQLSALLLSRCDKLLERNHYRKNIPIGELFEDDKAACSHLPRIGFDACSWQRRTVDKVGNIQVDNHMYLVGSQHALTQVHVGIRAQSIEILNQSGQRIIEHSRSYSTDHGTVFDPVSVLPNLIRRPGSYPQSLLRPLLPQALARYLDHADNPRRAAVLRMMYRACQMADFASIASSAADLLTHEIELNPDNLFLAVRATLQPPTTSTNTVDLTAYDALLPRTAS
ncbi:IS21 family transposase [Actinobaculum suis]|uniref:IS21 family transposase n=1 Tax=Actinobaculum suis TaxID=1657 RepID=UPI001FCF95FA|nr:IS21 family transposase [Actinobaculum suis]